MQEIKCDLGGICEYPGSGGKEKKGRYHNSIFHEISDFGKKRWVVAAKIYLDFGEFGGCSADEIGSGCIAFLNKPPIRKKYTKRQLNPKYGKLQLHKSELVERSGEKYLSVLLVVEERKNPNFWGKGQVLL